jgi:hypothetical protein
MKCSPNRNIWKYKIPDGIIGMIQRWELIWSEILAEKLERELKNFGKTQEI